MQVQVSSTANDNNNPNLRLWTLQVVEVPFKLAPLAIKRPTLISHFNFLPIQPFIWLSQCLVCVCFSPRRICSLSLHFSFFCFVKISTTWDQFGCSYLFALFKSNACSLDYYTNSWFSILLSYLYKYLLYMLSYNQDLMMFPPFLWVFQTLKQNSQHFHSGLFEYH